MTLVRQRTGNTMDGSIPITHVNVQSACGHDSQALVPAIADTQVRGLGPKKVLADTLYGSDTNEQVARVAGTALVVPTNKGGKTDSRVRRQRRAMPVNRRGCG